MKFYYFVSEGLVGFEVKKRLKELGYTVKAFSKAKVKDK